MLNPLLQAAADTVRVVQDSGFDVMDFVKTIVGAVIVAAVSYFGSKHGANKAISGKA